MDSIRINLVFFLSFFFFYIAVTLPRYIYLWQIGMFVWVCM